MSKRDKAIQQFLADCEMSDWQRVPLVSDASKRRYFRLTRGNSKLILMDSAPEVDPSLPKFIQIGGHLIEHGFAAPEILHVAEPQGLAIIEDLGQNTFKDVLISEPASEQELYDAATDILVALLRTPVPDGLDRLSPQHASEMIQPAIEWCAHDPTQDKTSALLGCLKRDLANFASAPTTLSLRDFHIENLIWRSERSGTGRVGLLDFQDAICAPSEYDLVSLIKDARRPVKNEVQIAARSKVASALGQSAHQFTLGCACLGVQRNLRILGIFSRLARLDGKTRYLDFMPIVWGHLLSDLTHPELSELSDAFQALFPSLEQIQKRNAA